jgi:serine/threonine-protein kinase
MGDLRKSLKNSVPDRKADSLMENRSPDPQAGKDVRDDKETKLPPRKTSAKDLSSTRVLSTKEEEQLANQDQMQKPAAPIGAEGSVLGEFQIIRKLGEGAMGAVYLARQPSFENRQVALKVLFPHVAGNAKLVKRLQREASVMFDLDHPNIVKSLGIDKFEGWHYIAMEFVDGESLQKSINKLGKIPVPDAIHVAIACAKALQYAHGKGMIHRDIKPDNVLVSRSGKVKVTDLGMVKKLDADEEKGLTMTGHAVGTPWYMPLEQAKNAKDADARCDIYALGCLVYCMLTGHPPFTGSTIVEVIQAKERGAFPPARSTNAEVSERLDLIIGKMVQKLPKNRYQNCAELITDLESLQLASAKLEFPRERKPKKQTGEEPTPTNSMVATLITSTPVQDTDGDKWFVRMKNSDGDLVTKTMLTLQMVKMVEEGTLRPSVQISRNAKEGFRALATYKEFQSVAAGRAFKTGMDQRKTVDNKKLYDQIVKKEIQRDVKKDEETTSQQYWMQIFVSSAIGVLAVGGVLFVIYYLLSKLVSLL